MTGEERRGTDEPRPSSLFKIRERANRKIAAIAQEAERGSA